jgi:hypothetical protein
MTINMGFASDTHQAAPQRLASMDGPSYIALNGAASFGLPTMPS